MTTLYITRHGETLWNTECRIQGWHDSPLTELGIKQALDLGERLKEEQIDIIYTSSCGRAVKTAELIRGIRNIKIISKDSLREINLGAWEGYTKTEKILNEDKEFYNFWNNPGSYKKSSGEDFIDLNKRIIPEILHIIESNKDKKVLIVTHAIALKSIMTYFERKDVMDIWNTPQIAQTSLCIVDVKENNYIINAYGDCSHIKECNTDQWAV